ncbi:MAG TPA: HNH endonuclease [Dehalococcoidia bacterium]|nr:HNH endonuclease [Dehalococcoidia bacterium]
MRSCLFCKKPGGFQTREHIVPESLGNDTDILEGVICSSCQNYFGKEIEKAALEQTPIAFWRSYLGIRTKRGRLPSVDLNPPARGAIPAFHPASDTDIGFSAHEDGSTSIDVDNSAFIQRLLSKDKGEYRMVLSPWHLSIIGRFLGKMGLEYVALSDLDYAFSAQFEDIRSFVRYGSTKHLWPIYWGQQDKLGDLKEPVIWDGSVGHQEIECYRYALARMVKDETIFVFSIGVDLMAICLTKRLPIQNIENCIAGTKLSCVFYPDGSW